MRNVLTIIAIVLLSCNSENTSNTDIKPFEPKIDSTLTPHQLDSLKQLAKAVALSDYQTTNPNLPSDPYEIMHTVFVGMPEKEEIKPMMEMVMREHNFDVNGDNALKFANMLLALRKESVVGVTEMDILKHMYQHGNSSLSLSEQGGISAAMLEKTK